MKKENQKQYNETLEQMSKNKKEVIEFSINCIYNGDKLATILDFKGEAPTTIPVVDLITLNMLMTSMKGNYDINLKMSKDETISEENREFYKGVSELCSEALTMNHYYLEYLKTVMNNPNSEILEGK